MLSLEQIERLEAFDAEGAQVLSVYLSLNPDRQLRHAYRIMFKDLVKDALDALGEAEREALQRERDQVQAWLDEHEPGGKGLAIFSCSPRKLFEAHWLPVCVQDHLAFELKPDVAPLLEIVDEYERYAVALVDKRHARLFTVFAGEIEESKEIKDFVFSHHDQGGWSQANYQRHHEAHVFRHLKRVAEYLTDLYRRREFDRLVLAGPEEPIAELRRLLPRALAQRLVGTIPAETGAKTDEALTHEILKQTLEIGQRAEREVEERLLAELLDRVGAGGRATLGLRPTLNALWLGEIQTLLVAERLQAAGHECPNCGRLAREADRSCPVCGTLTRPVHDVLHRAMGRVLELDGSVEIVHGDVARRLAEQGDGIGALLRYR